MESPVNGHLNGTMPYLQCSMRIHVGSLYVAWFFSLVGRLFDRLFSLWISFVGRLVMCFLALPGYRELFAMHVLCL
jgi:hypothetical protein